MRVSITGGSAQPVGPPGFGQLNDIHVHKTGYGLSGIFSLILISLKLLKVYGFTLSFFRHFYKGNNFCDFLFASLGNKTLPKRNLLLNESTCSCGSMYFPLTVDPY